MPETFDTPRFPTPLLPILTAPTAAGKSALALGLARKYPIELVSADAFTVYRGLDTGTAKPTLQDRADAPHHLIDVADVHESYDVARWLAQAEAAVADILARGRWPLIVGGTGFYLSALRRGLPLTPPSDPSQRALIEAELAERGLDALLADIAALSLAEAQRMERNPRRVVRALEIRRRTGRFPGEFGYTRPRYAYQVFAFSPPDLEGRIAARVRAMLGAGWPQEAGWLADQVSPDTSPRPTVWQALGYAEALALYRSELTSAQAEQRIAQATRQYARRQLTWARTQLGAAIGSEQRVAAQLQAFLSSWVSPGE